MYTNWFLPLCVPGLKQTVAKNIDHEKNQQNCAFVLWDTDDVSHVVEICNVPFDFDQKKLVNYLRMNHKKLKRVIASNNGNYLAIFKTPAAGTYSSDKPRFNSFKAIF